MGVDARDYEAFPFTKAQFLVGVQCIASDDTVRGTVHRALDEQPVDGK